MSIFGSGIGGNGPHDEDSDDKLLNQLGKAMQGKICRKLYTDKKGYRVRCMKKKGHWGRHK